VQISQNYQGIELFFKGKTSELSSCPVDHGGLTAVASREARWSTARQCCRARELAASGAKRGGHSGNPYRLHKRAVEGRRRAGGEVELVAAVAIRVERLGVRRGGVKGGTR
jgi:hypothetical protein